MDRLNLGCGPTARLGWINCDIDPWPGVNIVTNITKNIPLADNSMDYIVSIHVLPEIPYRDLDDVLQQIHRILKPGGVVRLSLPDADLAIQAYLNQDRDYFLIGDEIVQDLGAKMIVQLTWFGQSRCLFTYGMIRELLARNGFIDIEKCSFRVSPSQLLGITDLDDRPLESLFIEARKPVTVASSSAAQS
jgi:predicted SAM-dependent methyltransferase